jgi:hypothetical protein
MNAFNKLRMMFEQNTVAVKRMRPKIDLFRENLARHDGQR